MKIIPYEVDIPVILQGRSSSLLEQDCACAAEGPLDGLLTHAEEQVLKNPHSGFALETVPDLHWSALIHPYELVFNPGGPASMAVLNPAARRVLEAFARPAAPPLAAGQVSGMAPASFEQAWVDLYRAGLVRRPGMPPVKKSAPQTLTAWLHVTNQCNLRCSYCYITKTPEEMELVRGKQAVAAVFRSALANGFSRVKLKYAGGEAALNLDLVLALQDYATHLAYEKGLLLEGVLLSNGIGINSKVTAALQAQGLRLSISLDGVGANHDTQRHFANGKGSFHLVERSLDRLEEAGFRPSIIVTVSRRNLAGLPEVVSYLLKRGLPFSLNFYRENECSASDTDLVLRDEETIAAMRLAFTAIKANLPDYSLLNALVDRASLESSHDRPCSVGQSYLVIDQKGGVAKCHMEIERTVTDIHAEDPLALIRADQIGIQNRPVDEREDCRECRWRYWCAGGCPALTFRVTGRFDRKSPDCQIYQALFPEVLRLEGLRLLKERGLVS